MSEIGFIPLFIRYHSYRASWIKFPWPENLVPYSGHGSPSQETSPPFGRSPMILLRRFEVKNENWTNMMSLMEFIIIKLFLKSNSTVPLISHLLRYFYLCTSKQTTSYVYNTNWENIIKRPLIVLKHWKLKSNADIWLIPSFDDKAWTGSRKGFLKYHSHIKVLLIITRISP